MSIGISIIYQNLNSMIDEIEKNQEEIAKAIDDKIRRKISLNSRELAIKLSVHVRTIARWVKKGMPCLKPNRGGGLRFNYEAVLAWLGNEE